MILGFLFLLTFIIVILVVTLMGLSWIWILVIGLVFMVLWYIIQNLRSKKEHTKLGIKA